MFQDIKILHSKLLAPRISETIERERLLPLVSEIPKKRVTTVTAGAGYGKTTLVAQITSKSDTVWYRLDASDIDYITFLNYLCSGISKYYPEFKVEVTKHFQDSQVLKQDIKVILTAFLHEMEKTVKNELIIVLDDYHLVQENLEICDITQFIIEHLPPCIHVIITSRATIGLALSRFRALRDVIDITSKDLAFTHSEVKQLFEEIFKMKLKEETLDIISKRSQGWVASLILFYHSLRGKDWNEIDELLTKLHGSDTIIFKYLEENIYKLLSQEIRSFLIKTSILSRLNSHFCDEFLGINNSMKILRYLVKSHLFTFSLDDKGQEYSYHHLFQDFLQTMLNEELTKEDIVHLHFNAARVFEKQGLSDEAINHYILAESYDKACQILGDIGIRMVMIGQMYLIKTYLTKIPQEYFLKYPWIIYLQATVYNLSGIIHEAIQVYQKAYDLFEQQGIQFGMDLCVNQLAFIYFMMGNFTKAEKQNKKLLDNPSLDPYVHAIILINLVFISAMLGKLSASDEYYQECINQLEHISDNFSREELRSRLIISRAQRLTISGNLHEAITLAEQGKTTLDIQKHYRLLTLHYNVLASANFHAGFFSQGLDNAKAGLTIVREKGFRDVMTGWLQFWSCSNSIGLNNLPDAINYGQQALKSFQDLGSSWGQVSVCIALYDAYMKSGNIAAAEDILNVGLEASKYTDLPMVHAQLKIILAFQYIGNKRYKEADELIQKAQKEFSHSKLFNWWIYWMYTYLYWEQGQKDLALSHLVKGLEVARANHYDIWVIAQWPFLLPAMVELLARDVMVDYVHEIIHKIGQPAQEELRHLKKSTDPRIVKAVSLIIKDLPKAESKGLYISCLGRFKVFIGDDEIPAKRWKSKKAKMLFKLLLYYRSKGYVSKEVFMEHLWPEEDPQKTAKRFHVALATLRKVLEPHMGTLSSYILSDGDTYLLDLGAGGWIDFEKFGDQCKLVKEEQDQDRVIAHLLKAESLYHGDFLEEDLYEPWCIDIRDQIRSEYLSVLASISDYYEFIKEYQRSIDFCNRYLHIEPYTEDIYQQLMRCYSLLGNRTMVKKTFMRCKDTIVEGLNCPLSKETELLYNELIKE